ncbi:glycosyltransferase family 4 protein [Sphingobium sp. H39-3-25]|uniref:glycosyltransferase family 4 protein n=1 Tax=Sphingobium arseniciresistens TaxID=3030834 RepID=UPI0023B8CBC8|nr:glycosyltransferase family 4 protein [Sphingobium arseniciresistens]
MHYYVHDQASSLVNNQVQVTVFSPSTQLAERTSYRHKVAFQGVYGKAPKPLRAARLLFNYVKAIAQARASGARSCIFHIFKSDAFEAFAVGAAKAAGLRVHCVIHDVARLDAAADFSLIRQIVGMSNGVIVHNGYSRDALLAAAPGASGKTTVVHHGNYIERFEKPPTQYDARAALRLPQDRMILLFFGNPRREKGLHVLLEALAPLAGRNDLLLLVAGKMKAPEEKELRDFIGARGMDSIVRIDAGHVADGDVPDYYCAASIVALPYLRVYESGVGLMAMSLRRPILASNVPVFRDLVEESGGGVLFESDDPSSLREQVMSLLDQRHDCERLGEHALKFAQEKRSWDTVGEILAEAMKDRPGHK